MAFFTSDSIYLADLYQFSDQRGGVDSYNIKQLSPVTPEKESLLDSRQRGNGADISTQRGPSANLRTASHKPKKRLTKNVAYKKPPSSETLKQPRQSHNLVEKRYRSRLKNHFESLLAVLPVPLSKDGNHGDNYDRRFSRAEVLVSARDRIVSLEEGFEAMAKERDQLLTHIALMYEFTY
ncbi:allergen fus c 3 [Fusarium flagelliforme]|uniref:Allergen fus c 3 n=1 Tax=Fusarium flagelliforme TaxID=2675880 RepID=A0A395M566_9HYPO|nr:allergen fus c 3 [Fusarium flagelliforme]